jgi:hypothetical protein
MRLSSKIHPLLFAAFSLGFWAIRATATTYYVDINSPNPTPPYTSWNTASTDIQSAIDQSANGDLVLVNDGVYQTGGETINGHVLTNRVAIDKPITVQSVNGPAVTVIQGNATPLYPNIGVRCVYMTNNATLIGFTLNGGNATAITSLDNVNDDSGGGAWCETNNSILSNCVITANFAIYDGGGVYQGTLFNCTVSQNSIVPAYNSNRGGGEGGGVFQSILINCMVISNAITNMYFQSSFAYGSGAYNSELTNCVVADNWTSPFSEITYGGGAYQGTLVNCTITGNSSWYGGGTYNSTLINCINYYNMASDPSSTNYDGGVISYTCTTPNPFGIHNFTNAPLLASVSCISTNSPCRGAGNAAVTIGVDINGNPWANPPSIGCDEPIPGNVAGTNLTVSITTAFTNYPPGYAASFQANISSPVSASVWNFGDGTIVTNVPFLSHTWPALGTYPVTLTAYNDSYPTGVTANLTINISTSLVYYVDLNSHYPAPPYRTWNSAATTIQDAVNAANAGSLVLVTNGTTHAPNTNNNALYYNGGMTAPNGLFYRVVVTNPITVESVHGPSSTLIVGTSPGVPSAAGVYLTTGATLIGFCLTNSTQGGIYAASTNVLITNCVITHCTGGNGGVYLGTLVNCLITNSSGAYGSVGSNCIFAISGEQDCLLNNCVISNNTGSGAYGGILNNCLITHNSSSTSGGGAYGDFLNRIVLNNCVISNNTSTSSGGGVAGAYSGYTNCILNNCLVVSNLAKSGFGGGAYQAQLNNCIISSNRVANSGGGAANCLLSGCTLIGNPIGGGAYESVLTNCAIINNNPGVGAENSTLYNCLVSNNAVGLDFCAATGCKIVGNQYFEDAGGAYGGTLTNCLLTENICASGGGAAANATLVNCTVVNNGGGVGGVNRCYLYSCIIYDNTNGNYLNPLAINYCCTYPLPGTGYFNITNDPLYVNVASNFHLQSTSPCINSGNNIYVSAATDLDGNPRIVGGTVDVGAYEYQTPTSVISYAYLQKYGLPTDGSVDFANLDGTSFNVYQDWIAGLNPTNPASVLVMLPVTTTNTASGITVAWQSVNGILYNLQRTTNMPPSWATIQSNLIGSADTTTYSDTSATNGTPYFYRVGVQAP